MCREYRSSSRDQAQAVQESGGTDVLAQAPDQATSPVYVDPKDSKFLQGYREEVRLFAIGAVSEDWGGTSKEREGAYIITPAGGAHEDRIRVRINALNGGYPHVGLNLVVHSDDTYSVISGESVFNRFTSVEALD